MVIWLGKWKDHMQIIIMVDALFIISHFLVEKDVVAVLTTELQKINTTHLQLFLWKASAFVLERIFQKLFWDRSKGVLICQTITRVYFPEDSRCAQIIAGQGPLSVCFSKRLVAPCSLQDSPFCFSSWLHICAAAYPFGYFPIGSCFASLITFNRKIIKALKVKTKEFIIRSSLVISL